MNNIPENICHMFFVMTLKSEDRTFDDVDRMSVEIDVMGECFTALNVGIVRDSSRNGAILGDVYRLGNRWAIKKRGYFLKNITNFNDYLPYIDNIS